MLDDLLELTTTLVHPDHTPRIARSSPSPASPEDHPSSSTMPPRRSAHAKSASVSSATGVDPNGAMLAPSTPTRASPTSTRKSRAKSTQSPPASPVAAVPRKSAIAEPVPAQPTDYVSFVVAVVSSILLEALLQSLASFAGTGDLAAVSKHADSWPEIGGLLLWKVVQLGIYWVVGFDAYDVASITLLITTPSHLLLSMFYTVSATTTVLTTTCSLVSKALPFYFFRGLSPAHDPTGTRRAAVRNRPILTDPYTTIATSLLATAIFAVLLEIAFATVLPTLFVTRFEGIRTLEPIYRGAAGLLVLLLWLIPTGVACMEYLFAPSTATPHPEGLRPFDPATAGIVDHIRYNLWGMYSVRQRELAWRTALAAYLVLTETVIELFGTVRGVELEGAVWYGVIWSGGLVVVGVVLDWVGGPSD